MNRRGQFSGYRKIDVQSLTPPKDEVFVSMKFEDLEVWKKSARLSTNLYKRLVSLQDFGFRAPLTRSGLSIPSNIAEGIER